MEAPANSVISDSPYRFQVPYPATPLFATYEITEDAGVFFQFRNSSLARPEWNRLHPLYHSIP